MNRPLILIILMLAIVSLVKSESAGHVEYSSQMDSEHSNQMNSEHSSQMHSEPVDAFHMGVGENPFWLKEQNFVLWLHIIIMTISLGTLIPIGITLGFANIKSKWYINVHIAGIIMSLIGFFFGIIFRSSKSQDIYPMNFHSKFGWIILFILLIQTTFGFIRFAFNENNRFISLS